MRFLVGLIAYMALGGLLIGPPLLKYERDGCGDLSVVEAATVMATWPAWLAIALVTGPTDNGKCVQGGAK